MSDSEDSYGEDYDIFLDDADSDHLEMDKQSYRVITTESLASAQRRDLQRVAEMLGIKSQHARTLLIYYRWNIDVIAGQLVESGKEELLRRAGVLAVPVVSRELPPTITCEICFEDVPSHQATQMSCSHVFCNECWLQNFSVKITDGYSKRLVCMAPKCGAICDEEKVREILQAGNADALARYERSLLESYVDDNGKLKWCTSVPHCGNAMMVEGEPYCEVECACTHQFCFNCGKEPHSPCSCDMWNLWEKKCKDESETSNYLAVYTKPCPKCSKPVEKNDGCNLVICLCSQAFCWLCGAATGRRHTWSSIEGHTCGSYKEDIEKRAADAERSLKRYVHYYTRWRAHLDSLIKFEYSERQAMKHKTEALEQCDLTVRDYTWLWTGLDMLFKARRALAYSYPFAFFMFGNELYRGQLTTEQIESKKYLFEHQQGQFEAHVERLSSMIKESASSIGSNVVKFRCDFVSATTMTDNLCRRLYEIIENDLLDSLHSPVHIAPYISLVKGPRASTSLNNILKAENPPPTDTELPTDGKVANASKRPSDQLVLPDQPKKIRV